MKNLLILTQKVDSHDQLLGFFIPWLRRFARHFGTVTVLCLEEGEHDLPDSVRVFGLGKDRRQSKLRQLWNFYRLTYSLRPDYDAVLVHMNPIWAVVGTWWWHLFGKPVSLWYTHKAVTWKLRLAERWVDRIFTASAESFRIPSSKVIVTGHGIDTDAFAPDPSVERIPDSLLVVGRIAPVKNYETVVDALARVATSEFMLTVVGEPALAQDRSYAELIQERVWNAGLAERVAFAGKLSNAELPAVYRTHQTFIHTSRTGSVDKALLEAMASGMYVISSNESSRAFLPPECLVPEDDPQALADALVCARIAPIPPSLRQYVVEHHNLDILIEKVSKMIAQSPRKQSL
jgi:glycosyltransferase involved in cell wall biosynthesis